MGKQRPKEQWYRQKHRGYSDYLWQWDFDVPKKERPMWRSKAVMDERGVLEIYLNLWPGYVVDEIRSAKTVGKLLTEGLGTSKYISVVDAHGMMATLKYYTKVEALPDQEFMAGVQEMVYRNISEAYADRWDARTGEYQGRFTLTGFTSEQRFQIYRAAANTKGHETYDDSRWKIV